MTVGIGCQLGQALEKVWDNQEALESGGEGQRVVRVALGLIEFPLRELHARTVHQGQRVIPTP